MKKQTQQTEQNPCPERMSAPKAIALFIVLAGTSAGAGIGIGKVINYSMAPSKTVTCHECDHVVARSSASQKKKFKHYFGKDEEYTTLYFCKEHPKKWDYALDAEGTEAYFKKQYDHQVDRNGCEITNTTWHGWSVNFGTNETDTPTIKKMGYVTNIGGSVLSKHIIH